MNNTDKLLRAFIEASGFDIEDIDSGRTEQFGTPIIDYKVTKKEAVFINCTISNNRIFLGNWKGTDVFVKTEQEDELREMLLDRRYHL